MSPLKYPDYQREFTFQINGHGLPVAQVITLGQGRWLTVCPCCGCAHDVMTHRGDVCEPKCILKVTHPKVYAAWLERFPEASKYTRVELVSRPLEIRPYAEPKKQKKAEKSVMPAHEALKTVFHSEAKTLRKPKVLDAPSRARA